MGDRNQYEFVKKNRDLFHGPFLEIGSRRYDGLPRLHELFPEGEWIGVDRSAGEGVDLVADGTAPFEEVDKALGRRRFATIFCLSVLEHCENPFVMAQNLTRLLEPDGLIFVSVPFAWKFHGYPSDYWRFTAEGVQKLFPDIVFLDHLDHGATSFPGETFPLDGNLGRIAIRNPGRMAGKGHWFRALELCLLRALSLFGPMRWLVRYRYLFPPVMVNRVGRPRSADSRDPSSSRPRRNFE